VRYLWLASLTTTICGTACTHVVVYLLFIKELVRKIVSIRVREQVQTGLEVVVAPIPDIVRENTLSEWRTLSMYRFSNASVILDVLRVSLNNYLLIIDK
jgi:hypothetical protein